MPVELGDNWCHQINRVRVWDYLKYADLFVSTLLI